MADVTVAQFAEVLKVPVEKLLVQLDQAGIKVAGPNDKISDEAKLELLSHLRRSHGQSGEEAGAVAAPRKITLQRKQQSEIKLAGGAGRARTVNVEVRVKRTYVKRDVLEEQAKAQGGDDTEAKRLEAEEAARLERERLAELVEGALANRSGHEGRVPRDQLRATASSASPMCLTVRATSASVCAFERNAASYCEGGQYSPRAKSSRWKTANFFVSLEEASAQFFTGPFVKKSVIIEPTRCTQPSTPVRARAASRPLWSCAPRVSRWA